MRVTMAMTTNRMLLQINRNAARVDKLYSQMTSGKKIQFPSDDPIIASRALKFRTNIAETEQYQRNVQQGTSWMEITESAFTNVIKGLKRIRELCIEGSTDSNETSDRDKIVKEISSLYEQLCYEMNVDYAGRYVFSGYRTDEPATFTESNKASFNIKQWLNIDDIEQTICYYKDGTGAPPEQFEGVNRIKLPYTDATMPAISYYTKPAGVNTPITAAVTAKTLADPDCYDPGDADVFYIAETGELILGKDIVTELQTYAKGGIELEYTKANFSIGELNPKVYFNCQQTADKNGVALAPPVEYLMGQDPNANPETTYATVNAVRDKSTQEFQFEFGTNTLITINNLAKNALTASMVGDLRSLVNDLSAVKESSREEIQARLLAATPALANDKTELERLTNEQMKNETSIYRGLEHDRFNNMIGLIDKHMSQISTEHTLLGSRMNRMELIEERLEGDVTSYTKLMSDNENVDYLEVIMKWNEAQSVYQAALMSGAKIAQLSLADYIR